MSDLKVSEGQTRQTRDILADRCVLSHFYSDSLKVLEKQVVEKQVIHQNHLTEGAIRVMDLMDRLL
jgi:hypothetical protein